MFSFTLDFNSQGCSVRSGFCCSPPSLSGSDLRSSKVKGHVHASEETHGKLIIMPRTHCKLETTCTKRGSRGIEFCLEIRQLCVEDHKLSHLGYSVLASDDFKIVSFGDTLYLNELFRGILQVGFQFLQVAKGGTCCVLKESSSVIQIT